MRECGRAAVVHPTGTGKSFIGFKLCEDNPQKVVCWLSPSEYIFKTQLENLSAAANGFVPQNIKFFTYARLMNATDEEISEITPDFIVLDEFHRCGAEQWGKGVEKLLSAYKNAQVLGLSATNVRYLDNQRDMAEELFDGNVASEITLGEAIVRGILNAPKYVLCAYSCEKSLKKYERKVANAKNKAVRAEAEKYLDALRRSLNKADGLEEVFAKHITDKNGRYIAFCSDYNHLAETAEKIPEWVSKIDLSPHIYTAYSQDPNTDKEFAAFKADDGDHLKILLCIDMLNEGVHIDGVSGVILLRPTVSPIIYKQQIGRALSADKKSTPVIFDIVLNIENLYSIGALEDETVAAVDYYRSTGENKLIVNENFKIFGEIQDCVKLFNALQNTLSASWDYMYEVAKEYYKENGNLEVKKKFVTKEGYSLGSWLNAQRRVYNGKISGNLSKERIKKLEEIGMNWQFSSDAAWEKAYAAAENYYKEKGDLLVPVDYAADGISLGKWVSRLRQSKAALDKERVAALEKIGMVWSVSDFVWERNFASAKEYFIENGNLNVPGYFVDKNGVRLGQWIGKIKAERGKKLGEDRLRALNAIGFNKAGKQEGIWQQNFEALCAYKAKNGTLDVPAAFVTESGCKLGRWVRLQRDCENTMSGLRKAKLDAVGFEWSKKRRSATPERTKNDENWHEAFTAAKEYYAEHGNLRFPPEFTTPSGKSLATWVKNQKLKLARGDLSPSRLPLLEEIGINKREK